MCVRIGARSTGIGGVSEEIASCPEKFDTSLLLELQGEVCHLIQVPVGLLKDTAHGGDVPEEKVGGGAIYKALLRWCHGKTEIEEQNNNNIIINYDTNLSWKVQYLICK